MPYLFTSESVSEGHPDKVATRSLMRLLTIFLHLMPNPKWLVKHWLQQDRLFWPVK